jgi:MFS family permease
VLPTPRRIERTYVLLILLQTLAASLIWGINTLFLLDAGLSLTQSFIANAAFTAGMVLFEIPTGMVADLFGRRTSFLVGATTLAITTLLYLLLWRLRAGIAPWMIVSALIGLGFTFFSGATEAWLVDALGAAGYQGRVETVFAKGQVAEGAATLTGTVAGGLLAQISLGVPYIIRAALLILLVVAAALTMRDYGFQPHRRTSIQEHVRELIRESIRHGFGHPSVRMFMLAAPFASGVGIWVFYSFQPYVLALSGRPDARWLSGIAAAVFAAAQMAGGAAIGHVTRRFATKTGFMIFEAVLGTIAIAGVGLAGRLMVPVGLWVAVAFLAVLAMGSAITEPLEQAFINPIIPASQRATVLSFKSLMGSAGGVVIQPALGRVADLYSLGVAYVVAGVLFAVRLPFLLVVRALRSPSDGHGTEPAP